jgi:hypothetical protein
MKKSEYANWYHAGIRYWKNDVWSKYGQVKVPGAAGGTFEIKGYQQSLFQMVLQVSHQRG